MRKERRDLPLDLDFAFELLYIGFYTKTEVVVHTRRCEMMTTGKAPSTLNELRKLIDSTDDGENGLIQQWLQYTYDSLYARKMYHKKQQIKRRMIMKVASELLSDDERESIDTQAEGLAEREIDVQNATPTPTLTSKAHTA